MAGESQNVKVIITGEDRYSAVAGKVSSATATIESAMGKAKSTAMEFAKGLIAVNLAADAASALRGAAGDTLKTAAAFEKTEIMLKRLTGSAESGKSAFNWITDFAAQAPFALDTLQDAFVKLQVAGLDPMGGKLRILTDAVAAFGGSSQQLERATLAIQQMSGKGVISMEELRGQLGEALPTAMKIMAKELGMSMGELSDKVGKGALDAKTGLDALFRGLEKEYGGAAGEMMKSWDGLMTQVSIQWKKVQKELMDRGAFDTLKGALTDVKKYLDDAFASGKVDEWARAVASGTETAISGLKTFGSALVMVKDNADTVLVALTAMTAASVVNGLVSVATKIGEIGRLSAAAQAGLIGMAAAAAWAGGKWIDKKAFEWFDVDISGMNRPVQEMGKAQGELARKTKLLNEELKKQGLGSWEEFEAAVKKGTATYNEATGKWEMAAKKQETAAEKNATALKAQEDAMKTAVSDLDKYSKAISNLGREQLKLAEQGFSRDLERQEEFFKKNGALAQNLAEPLKSYMRVIDEVYGKQLEAQRDIADVLKEIGAEKKSQIEQDIEILKTQKKQTEAALKGYEDYFKVLKGMHASAIDDMKKKQEELYQVKTANAAAQTTLNQTFAPQVPELDPYSKYFAKKDQLATGFAEAMGLTGEARKQALEKLREGILEFGREYKEGVKDVQTSIINDFDVWARGENPITKTVESLLISPEAVKSNLDSVLANVKSALEEAAVSDVEKAQGAVAQLETEMNTVEGKIGALTQSIVDFDNQVLAKERSVVVTTKDLATPQLMTIKNAIDSLTDKTITITTNYVSNIPSASTSSSRMSSASSSQAYDYGFLNSVKPASDSFKLPESKSVMPFVTPGSLFGSFATGTPYVPRTGPYLLHQGERVIPAEQNRPEGPGGPTLQFNGDINITLPNVSSADAKSAKELARAIFPEIQDILSKRYRTA